jgi:hypothetical protein
LAALVVGTIFFFTHQEKKIDTLNQDLGAAHVVNAVQTDTIDKQDKSSKVDDKVVAHAAEKQQVAVETTRARKVETAKKIAVIEQKYEALPQTEDNTKAEVREKSITRLESLHQAYCMTSPNIQGCPVVEDVTITKE